eukprot:CAMPEP_0179937418 /NCGR_PEP_ID=MMETSP0983-20121128/14310_1 /TAXON_ID=483367 /ORGANISM="non described non described, Strain CCMP 2436" /LENGTH=565 /DNA_ID=CAMNT_0021843127 /DNA_START=29 /DNA_END=1726 /DNA_ORIENTATION=-
MNLRFQLLLLAAGAAPRRPAPRVRRPLPSIPTNLRAQLLEVAYSIQLNAGPPTPVRASSGFARELLPSPGARRSRPLKPATADIGGAGVQPMPTTAQLAQAGRTDLIELIRESGGQNAVANALDLRVMRGRRPAAGTSTVNERPAEARARVALRLLKFAAECGEPWTMPPVDEFGRRGEHALLWAVRTHFGGLREMAELLGLGSPPPVIPARGSDARPRGYWKDFAHVKVELLEFIRQTGTVGKMPTQLHLRSLGRYDLAQAIRAHHGGLCAVAFALNLQPASSRTPKGHLADPSTLSLKLLAFLKGHVSSEEISGNHETYQNAILKDGGAARSVLKLKTPSSRGSVPRDLFLKQDPRTTEVMPVPLRTASRGTLKELLLREEGSPGVMPTQLQLQSHGRHDLETAIRAHAGGRMALARELGLKYASSRSRSPRGYWQDPPTIRAELINYVRTNGTAGVMPTELELRVAGARGRQLLRAITQAGGFALMAQLAGLYVPSHDRFGVWVIDTTREVAGATGSRVGRWQRQVATVDPLTLLSSGSTHRRPSISEFSGGLPSLYQDRPQ